MIRSMTGYARVEQESTWGLLSWELRSVNHRFLELALRLPEDLRGLEMAARERLQARLGRGKVDVGLRRDTSYAAAPLVLDTELVTRLSHACHDISRLLDSPDRINALEILRWPGVIRTVDIDLGSVSESALNLLDQGITALLAAREQEGGRLAEIVAQRASQMDTWVQQVRLRLPEVAQRLRTRLETRLAEVQGADPARLEQEMVLALQRLDVDEELVRLDTHLTEIRRNLDLNEPVGRRLDFLMQELNREANTLGSKSGDVETTRASVEMKVLIEQMREQVQNFE